MNFLADLDDLPQADEVQTLHLADVMEFIIDADIDTQTRIFKLIATQLDLQPLSVAEKILPQSYNGIKNYGKTLDVAGKRLVIMKAYK